jgi:hypothetical protein
MNKLLAFVCLLGLSACSFFGKKQDVSDLIPEKPDFSLRPVEYVPIQPFLTGLNDPVHVQPGFDQLIYAVDNGAAVVSFDQSGRQIGRLNIPGASFVIQRRNFDLLVAGTHDTTVTGLPYTYPCIYVIDMKVPGGEGNPGTVLNLSSGRVVKKIIFPFIVPNPGFYSQRDMDSTRIRAIGVLADNSFYATITGPEAINQNRLLKVNAVLVFNQRFAYQGAQQFGEADRSIAPYGLCTFVAPPQTPNIDNRLDFMFTTIQPDQFIRVQYVQVTIDDGTFFNIRPLPVGTPAQADGFLATPGKFIRPTSVAYTGGSRRQIFVTDAAKDSVFVFQETGFEGVVPPAASPNRRLIRVSFGGKGDTPTRFNNPVACAASGRTLFVVDRGNKRISRFQLTTDID